VFLANLMRLLPPDSFYLAFAAPDGEWHWSNFGDQDLVSVVRQKGKFSEDFVSSMENAIRNNQQPLVLVDTGGVMSPENGRIFDVCEGCIILANSEKSNDAIPAWREFAASHSVQVLAEIVSDLHGTNELISSGDGDGGKIIGRIAGLERGQTINSPVLEAVANRLREVIRSNSELTEGELLCNVNGATLVDRIGITEKNDPFLGVRPIHLQDALRLTSAVAKLETVRIWNVRAAILACAMASRFSGNIELYDVAKGYFRIPDAVPQGAGCKDCGVEWEVLELPEFTLVRFRPTRFITERDLPNIYPPVVDTTKPVVIAHDGPPMWLDATVVRAYWRSGVPYVAMLWPVESARSQKHLGGKKWDKVYPFAGPAVVVAGSAEKIGDIIPVSFDLLKWDAPVVGKLASGQIVIDRKDSHVQGHSEVLPLLVEALAKIHAMDRKSFCEEIRFCRTIGETICINTTDADEIIYAQRPNRRGLTRFVKNRQPEATSSVVACFMKNDGMGGAYLLTTAFIGSRAPAEPWDKQWATEESATFWNTHALIFEKSEIVDGTETDKCPW